MNFRQLLTPVFLLGLAFTTTTVTAEDSINPGLDSDIHAAIDLLLETSPAARELASTVKGVLVFPNVTKAGFVLGVQYGDGALLKRKQGGGYYIADYYTLRSASYGLQAGVQTFGYAMALMTDAAVEYAETGSGWELGVGPSIVIVDSSTSMANTLTTETSKSDVYAFTFGQEGLMAGLGIQGSKITKMNK